MTFAVLDVILKSNNDFMEEDGWSPAHTIAALTRSLPTKPSWGSMKM